MAGAPGVARACFSTASTIVRVLAGLIGASSNKVRTIWLR